MIILESEKSQEQIIELLQKQTRRVKSFYFISLFIALPFLKRTFAGQINENKFWLFMPYLAGRRTPFRVFFGTFAEEDNKTIITGKFKYPPSFFIGYLILLVIFVCVSFVFDIPIGFIFFMYPSFIIMGVFLDMLRRKSYEQETIEHIEKILE